MIPKSEFTSLADKIVAVAFEKQQDQRIIYRVEGREWIDSLYSHATVATQPAVTVMEFGAGVQETVQVMSVVVSTYKLLNELYSLLEKREPADSPHQDQNRVDIELIKNNWMEKMKNEKIDQVTAETIANTFAEELHKYLDS